MILSFKRPDEIGAQSGIVLIFRERLLPPSETFIVGQAKALRRYRPVLVGLRRTVPTLNHSLSELLLRDGSGLTDRIHANLYRRFNIGSRFFDRTSSLRPSIIHAHFAVDALQALPIAERLAIPLIVSLHGYDVTSKERALSQSFAGRHYMHHKERLFHGATAFVCVSRFIRDAALQAGFPESKLHVLYTGVDCERFVPSSIPRDPKLVLFVGRLVEKKGCEFLLRAMSHVQTLDPEAHAEIIGDGPLRRKLEEMAAALRLRVRFSGIQDSAEVRRRMSSARVLCNPSVTASSGDREGFGMVFAEAQAVGTPVVSFEHAAIPEAVSHGQSGLICPEGDVASLATNLGNLLDDDLLWEQMSRQSIRWVRENFDLARQAEKLERLYDDCILRTQSPRQLQFATPRGLSSRLLRFGQAAAPRRRICPKETLHGASDVDLH